MNRWSAAACGALAGAMMAYPGQTAEAAVRAMRLWAFSVVPVLAPFLICMLMITSRLGGGPWLRVALSWLCGSPGGARLMQPMGLRGRSALHYAALSGTMSPMFFLGTVSAWLANAGAGRLIFLCHVLGALLTGLCIPLDSLPSPVPPAPLSFAAALRDTALAMLTVALCMMVGCIAADLARCAFPAISPGVSAALQCLLEVTAGVKALIALGGPYTIPLVCAACSLGGLSLLMQNAAFWQESGVSMGSLLALRLVHALLSGLLCLALSRVL